MQLGRPGKLAATAHGAKAPRLDPACTAPEIADARGRGVRGGQASRVRVQQNHEAGTFYFDAMTLPRI